MIFYHAVQYKIHEFTGIFLNHTLCVLCQLGLQVMMEFLKILQTHQQGRFTRCYRIEKCLFTNVVVCGNSPIIFNQKHIKTKTIKKVGWTPNKERANIAWTQLLCQNNVSIKAILNWFVPLMYVSIKL